MPVSVSVTLKAVFDPVCVLAFHAWKVGGGRARREGDTAERKMGTDEAENCCFSMCQWSICLSTPCMHRDRTLSFSRVLNSFNCTNN